MATAKVDNNRGAGSFGSKRSRNDAREGDWKCSKCGNVNFSFRAVCNRGTCGAPRPSASPSPRMVPPAVGGGYEHRPSPYYGGAPPPPYGPPPPVGMSGSYGPAPYQHLGMRYGYGPGPYGSSGSYPPYSSYHSPGPMGGIGYGPGADMGRYGYGYRGSPMPGPSPWPAGALPDNNDNNSSRKRRGGPDGSPSEGDWKCPKCENVNFAFRTTCNMKKCGAPRPAYPGGVNSNGSSGKKEQGEAPEGSWTCGKCSNLNYPFRTVCNRKGCGNERPAPSSTPN
ncbi:ran BP2/NZF zinc finger-like superfamily protein [Carex rostrata]